MLVKFFRERRTSTRILHDVVIKWYLIVKRKISDEVGKGRQRQCYLQQIDYVKQCAYSKMVVIRMSFFSP